MTKKKVCRKIKAIPKKKPMAMAKSLNPSSGLMISDGFKWRTWHPEPTHHIPVIFK